MANAIKILVLCLTINLLSAMVGYMQSSPNQATKHATDWLGTSPVTGLINNGNQTASAYAACVAGGNSTQSCQQANSNPLAQVFDAWSTLWNVAGSIAAVLAFAAQAAIPWTTMALAINYMGLASGPLIFKVVAFVVFIVLLVLNIVQWITIVKVIRTGQLN